MTVEKTTLECTSTWPHFNYIKSRKVSPKLDFLTKSLEEARTVIEKATLNTTLLRG